MKSLIPRIARYCCHNSNRVPLVTNKAPNFQGQIYNPTTKNFEEVSLDNYKGKYLLLTFYPLDFTFVCPTEIVALNNLREEFKKRNCELLCCSIDSHFAHKAWCETDKKNGGFEDKLKLNLLSDMNKDISKDYGVLLKSGISLRGTFLIDPNQVVRHQTVNDLPVGRNMEEFLRLIDAFEFHDKNGDVCPANWKKKGDPTMKGSHTEQETKEYWEKHFESK